MSRFCDCSDSALEGETMRKAKTQNQFLAGLMLGGLVGSLASMLLAPHTGHKTREMLTERTRDMTLSAKEAAEAVFQRARREALDTVSGLRNLLRHQRVREAIEEVDNDEIRDTLDEAVRRIEVLDQSLREHED
jgi:gas vesicle protein